uniref:Candidate secreted effector n=1 Tax=Meloidogyne incognita TaxID=6306 RepID=A0A914NIM9_MELIC
MLKLVFFFSFIRKYIYKIKEEHVQAVIDPGKKFAKDSIRLVKKCTKPDRKGFFFSFKKIFKKILFRISKN